mgnify:CR=1 FL=1
MSRWSAAWSALTGRGFIPNQPPTSDTAGLVQRLQPWSAPPRRAAVEAPHAYLVHPILRMVAGKIATSVSRHVPKLYRVNAKGEKTEVFDHPALDLLRHPNDILTGLETRKLTQLYLDLAGENFWLLWANADGEPVRLFPLPPRWVVQVPDENRRSFRVSFQNLQMEIPAASILWMRDVNPESPYGRGTGITEALGDEIDVDEYAARYVKAFFYNRASPEIIVSAEGAKPEETARAKAKWDDEHRGWWNGFKTFWTGSKISVTRLDTTFRDSQLTELRAYQRDLIISTFGVPPEVLGIIENSNRATIDASSALYAEHVIEPRLAMLAENLNERLLPLYVDYEDRKGRLVFEFVNVIPEDRAFRLSVMQARPEAFTDNEARAQAGLPAVEGKDEFPPRVAPMQPGTLAARDADPEWTRSLPRHKRNTDDAARRAIEALRPERLTSQIDPVMRAGCEEWGKAILKDLGASARFDMLNPLIAPRIEQWSAVKIRGLVDDTTREALRSTLAEGVRAGESIDDLAVRVEDVFDEADTTRAEAIARTEVVGNSNWATFEAQKVSGVVSKRRWVATRDGRTRETHLALDGAVVGMNERFTSSSGASADYPGGFGVAAEDIQCRCTTVAEISDDLDGGELGGLHVADGAEKLDVVWRAYDSRLRPWESDAKAALRRGFADQRADVLRGLKGTT